LPVGSDEDVQYAKREPNEDENRSGGLTPPQLVSQKRVSGERRGFQCQQAGGFPVAISQHVLINLMHSDNIQVAAGKQAAQHVIECFHAESATRHLARRQIADKSRWNNSVSACRRRGDFSVGAALDGD
jgi:hypothetical protein